MKHIKLPHTDITVSQICLGGVNFGTSLSQAEAFALMDAFIDQGGNFIDSARVYSDWLPNGANASESTIGAWQKQRGNRDKIVLATKGAHPLLTSMHVPRMSPADIQHDIEASLKYLQTDTIDVYWLHRDDVSRPVGEILETLQAHVKAGQIRYYGGSNWTLARIQEAIDYAAAHGISGFVGNQPLWSLAEPNRDAVNDKTLVLMDDDGIAFHQRTQMPVIPYTSQARGFFSKMETGELNDRALKAYDSPLNRTRFERIRELAARHNAPVSAISLSYLTSQPFPVLPIIGASSIDQLNDSLGHSDLVLTPDEVAYLHT